MELVLTLGSLSVKLLFTTKILTFKLPGTGALNEVRTHTVMRMDATSGS
jgi:hypothetical protein